jgi:hypothetical protein
MAFTVDLEPDWGYAGTTALRRVTPRFLRFLEARRIHATFFVVSDLLDADEGLVRDIAREHEVGSHGRTHRRLDALSSGEARDEVVESRARLAAGAGPVQGFRAPFFRRCAGFWGLLRDAGYGYDASLGSVTPGPGNGRLAARPCPFRRGGLFEFPTSAMAGGWLPLSLTWLRLLWPWSLGALPAGAGVIYMHLHEFLPAETASCLPAPLRPALTRNCGERAWDILDAALEKLDTEFTTCRDVLSRLPVRTDVSVQER